MKKPRRSAGQVAWTITNGRQFYAFDTDSRYLAQRLCQLQANGFNMNWRLAKVRITFIRHHIQASKKGKSR